MKARGDYINGRFVRRRRNAGQIVSLDPGRPDETVGIFPTHVEAPAEALAAARTAFGRWNHTDLGQRTAALRRLQAQLRNRSEDLAQVLCQESGRPRWETRAEVRAMLAEVEGLTLGLAQQQRAGSALPAGAAVVQRPVGVVTVLSPYPQPLLLLHADAMAAIAAGCAVVCKPSPRAPASGQLYAEMVDEADLPRGVFNLVQGDDETGRALLAIDGGCEAVLFCGNERNAATLQQSLAAPAAPRLRTVTSGLSAALVLEDASLDQAAYQIAIGACISTGQRCTSTHRVIVDRRLADPLIERLVALLKQINIGHGARPDVFMGPLIDEPARDRYLETIERIVAAGARNHLHGSALDPEQRATRQEATGAFVTPCLLEVAPEKMADFCQSELVGPLLLLARVDGPQEAVKLSAAAPYTLSTAVFTRSQTRFALVFEAQRGGICLQNAPTTRWPGRLPLQPAGRSSNGWPWGSETSRVCTTLVVSSRDETGFDPTILPPGMPPIGL